MNRALIDTGAIYALVASTDLHHKDATAFLDGWIRRKGIFLLLDLVFIETMTLAKRRLGSALAIRIGRELRENQVFEWVPFTPDLEQDTWFSFQSYEDKEWSYTDCALFVMANRLNINRVFTFDKHFGQMPGVRCLP